VGKTVTHVIPQQIFMAVDSVITSAVEDWLEENKSAMVHYIMGRLGEFSKTLEREPARFATTLTIVRQDVLEEQIMKVSLESKGKCAECNQKVRGWSAPSGYFAPEAWATLREGGIDPATGHRQTCSHSKERI
jgi:Zn finger protein HypA/HybF involved in hydrogenase expression